MTSSASACRASFLACFGAVACGRIGFDPLHDDASQTDHVLFVSEVQPTYAVNIYAADAADDAAPIRRITGPTSRVNTPIGMFFDATHAELFVASFGTSTILVFPANARGDVAPIRALTTSSQPRLAIVDAQRDELIVLTLDGGILFFPRLAEGAVAPLRTIGGALTRMQNSLDMSLDPVTDELYVTTEDVGTGAGGILVFDRSTSGNVAPKRMIAGPTTGFARSTYTLALDLQRRELFTVAGSGGNVVVFDMGMNGDTAPKRSILGFAFVGDLLIDVENDRIDVLDRSARKVIVLERGASGSAASLLTLETPLDSIGLASSAQAGLTGPLP